MTLLRKEPAAFGSHKSLLLARASQSQASLIYEHAPSKNSHLLRLVGRNSQHDLLAPRAIHGEALATEARAAHNISHHSGFACASATPLAVLSIALKASSLAAQRSLAAFFLRQGLPILNHDRQKSACSRGSLVLAHSS